MADVFISYSKQEPEPTRELAAELGTRGFSVWWDTSLLAGDNFREVILKELTAARAVIVIWTPSSVTSVWVLSEAERAREAKKLVPLRLPAVPVRDIPPPFEVLNTGLTSDIGAIVKCLAALGAAPRAGVQWINRGNYYYNNGDYDKAITNYTEAIEHDTQCAVAGYNNRGLANQHKGEYDLAISDFTKAIQLDPKQALVYFNRGIVHAKRLKGDDVDRAIADETIAISLDRNFANELCRITKYSLITV